MTVFSRRLLLMSFAICAGEVSHEVPTLTEPSGSVILICWRGFFAISSSYLALSRSNIWIRWSRSTHISGEQHMVQDLRVTLRFGIKLQGFLRLLFFLRLCFAHGQLLLGLFCHDCSFKLRCWWGELQVESMLNGEFGDAAGWTVHRT
jgi:hypothetical protein